MPGRGRPRKVKLSEDASTVTPNEPRIYDDSQECVTNKHCEGEDTKKVPTVSPIDNALEANILRKRLRGRPRKVKKSEEASTVTSKEPRLYDASQDECVTNKQCEGEDAKKFPTESPVDPSSEANIFEKRGRGRPRKDKNSKMVPKKSTRGPSSPDLTSVPEERPAKRMRKETEPKMTSTAAMNELVSEVGSVEDPTDLRNAKIEDMLQNPMTHQAGLVILTSKLQASSGFSGPKASVGDKPKRYDAVSGPSSKPTQSGSLKEGMLMMDELLRRSYGDEKPKKPSTDSESEIDIEAISADLDAVDNGDFFHRAIPQYDLKKQLLEMHYGAIKRMKRADVAKICEELLPTLNDIKDGLVPSKRHDMYRNSTWLNRGQLHKLVIAQPFRDDQHEEIASLIIEAMDSDGKLREKSGRFLYYVTEVMVPEALIRIFGKVNNVTTEFAEKELRFGASYDGKLDEELMKTLPSGNDGAKIV